MSSQSPEDVGGLDDRGLTALIQVLEDAGIEHWIDSGVLLGLIRNGQLNSWEKDIDFGTTEEQLSKIIAATESFRRIGYSVSENRYHGVLYSLSLKPGGMRPKSDLRAALHVFYETGDSLWSPQAQIFVPYPAPDVYAGRRSWLGRALKVGMERWLYKAPEEENKEGGAESRTSRAPDKPSTFYRLVQWAYQRFDHGFMAETWPVREVYVPLTWVMPKRLVLPLTTRQIGLRRYSIPREADDYLTFRYGDWRTPVRNWCYWVDDGAIVHERPLLVRERLLRAHRALKCSRVQGEA